ncbi:AMP-binding protein [Amorphus orientalis]|uniref:Feruloyl-CoA synthase n=1 Tax=Amorphus orientalis TaxID=649198 RepID=A0AAE3VLZ6_9HYPH|nr:AMP-binding protein [Amorphus orientalis]MDQ0314492.1 feruloyl-CoA synthase [Amorphus orientalis]
MAAARDNRFAPVRVTSRRLPGGDIVLGSGYTLANVDRQVGAWLRRLAETCPRRTFIAERRRDGAWRRVSYEEAAAQVDRLSTALLDRDLGVDRPLAILSEKSVAHLLITLAALQIGVPVVPVSPAYSLRPEAFPRLRDCLSIVRPGLVFVETEAPFAQALGALAPDTEVVVADPEPGSDATPIAALLQRLDRSAVDAAFHAVGPETPAKILFTSGSTGLPKAVVNTHGNLCSNMTAMVTLLPFLAATPPTVVDWQPWHHCGGGNHNLHAVLGTGGSYYIDAGKPTDGSFGRTVENLRDISPTIHFGTPLSYDRLIGQMQRDDDLRRTFFRDLQCIYYSGAALPTSLWDAMNDMSRSERGEAIPIVTGYGMTEFSPLQTLSHWPNTGPDMIGVPVPGAEVRLARIDGGFELRGRGANLTPGYLADPERTGEALDQEGFFRTGDLVDLIDGDDAAAGLILKGRSAEQFKLTSGTWVPAGSIRTALIAACAPFVEDAVVVGEKRAAVGAFLILNVGAVRERFAMPEAELSELMHLEALHTELAQKINAYNAANPASSRKVATVACTADLPSIESGEMTDKGHINRSKYLDTRSASVEALYSAPGPAHVMFDL